MLHTLLEIRTLLALVFAAAVGTYGIHTYPIDPANPFIAVIQLRRPDILQVLTYGYSILWFSTPLYAASLLASLLTIVVYRRDRGVRFTALPPYPSVDTRDLPALVLGETH